MSLHVQRAARKIVQCNRETTYGPGCRFLMVLMFSFSGTYVSQASRFPALMFLPSGLGAMFGGRWVPSLLGVPFVGSPSRRRPRLGWSSPLCLGFRYLWFSQVFPVLMLLSGLYSWYLCQVFHMCIYGT